MRTVVGIDVGGTFTDLIAQWDNGHTTTLKTLTTYPDPAVGCVNAIKMLPHSAPRIKHVSLIVHATTIASNCLLTRSGPKTALITTKGFRDVLEIGRLDREEKDLYNLFRDKPEPLVPRNLRFEVNERINYRGEVLRSLKATEVRRLAGRLKELGVKSIAVCLLHSYANPIHELKISQVLRKEYPEAKVTLSSQIDPQIQEYERTSTTVVNAYILPTVSHYISNLEKILRAAGLAVPLLIMQSNGGTMTTDATKVMPVHMIESGPAAGVIASIQTGRDIGCSNLFTLDIGGTTAKTSLVSNLQPEIVAEYRLGTISDGKYIGGYPIRSSVINLLEIGSGGGSIAWVDSGGLLRVGPQSAGSKPGPSCYGFGGADPTATDAYLVLGLLNQEYFLGGKMKLSVGLAEKAIAQKVAKPLGFDLLQASRGIVDVMNAAMARAMRRVSVERGYDPRDSVLIPFGGAGPLHAVSLAKELEIPSIVVPDHPGIFSAYGLLLTDIRYDYVLTWNNITEEIEPQRMVQAYRRLEEGALRRVKEDGLKDLQIMRSVDMRYVGQGSAINIPLSGWPIVKNDLSQLQESFHLRHHSLYRHSFTTAPTEVVNLRITVTVATPKPHRRTLERGGKNPSAAFKYYRKGYEFEEGKMVKYRCYERQLLQSGNVIDGPAIVEQMDATLVIGSGQFAEVDTYGNIVISVAGR